MSIAHDLAKSFPHLPNPQQLYLFDKIDAFLRLKNDRTCFVLKGYAGTGKTTAISTLIKLLPKINLKGFHIL